MTEQRNQGHSNSRHRRKASSTPSGVSAEDVRRLVAKLKGEGAKK